MKRFPSCFISLLLILSAGGLHSALADSHGFDPTGKYELLRQPQATETPGKVEVVDVFWYGCPHCFSFLPIMEQYEKVKPAYVEIRRMPAIFRDSWVAHARAYYTAKILGVDQQIHRPLFEAIHNQKRNLDTREELMKFFERYGVSNEDFRNTYDSFAVETLMRKSRVMQQRYGITGTPTVIVNGKYRVSGRLAGSYENMLKVIQALAEKERNDLQASR